MQIKTFVISACDNASAEEELNHFLRAHRILHVNRQFSETLAAWVVMVEYQDGQPGGNSAPVNRKKDATADLTPEQVERYNNMRLIRNKLAEQRGVPAYLIFRNDELALLAGEPSLTAETAKKIKGIAPSRLRDSVSYFLDVDPTPIDDETSGTPD